MEIILNTLHNKTVHDIDPSLVVDLLRAEHHTRIWVRPYIVRVLDGY